MIFNNIIDQIKNFKVNHIIKYITDEVNENLEELFVREKYERLGKFIERIEPKKNKCIDKLIKKNLSKLDLENETITSIKHYMFMCSNYDNLVFIGINKNILNAYDNKKQMEKYYNNLRDVYRKRYLIMNDIISCRSYF